MTERKLGYEKNEKCNRDGCDGILVEHETDSCCSCHINPPCSHCTDSRVFCPECDWDGRTEQIEEENKIHQAFKHVYNTFKPRTMEDLDRTKIDYLSIAHTNSSMIKEGVFPNGTTKSQVLEKVKGTFGGRFVYFNEATCAFKYVAYTD